MKKGVLIVVIALLVVVGAVFFSMKGSNVPVPNDGFSGNSVEVKDFSFSPATINVNVGESITWTNKDSASHTIVSDSGSEIGSGTIQNDGTYSHTFNSAGTYAYHCGLH